MPRIDSVVLRVDKSISVRRNQIYIKQGQASDSPSRPQLENATTVREYVLADIRVNNGATAISQSNITNQIGRDTPFVELVNNTFDSANLIKQWESQFQDFIRNSTLDPKVLSPISNYTIDSMFVIK